MQIGCFWKREHIFFSPHVHLSKTLPINKGAIPDILSLRQLKPLIPTFSLHFQPPMTISPPPHLIFSDSPPIATPPVQPPITLAQDELKKVAAYKAVEFVESGMVIGLGTGSTATHAVDRIAELLRQGTLKNIVGVPTSMKTTHQAASLGIPLSDLDKHPVLDLAIDGADEVDTSMNLVKGRGGSLLREKMVESACKKFIVIVDETKLVKSLGGTGGAVPVEVVPFCCKFTETRLQKLFQERFGVGCVAKLRLSSDEEAFVTDNNNYIVDLFFDGDIGDLDSASDEILRLAGVVEHGMFLNMATTLIVAVVVCCKSWRNRRRGVSCDPYIELIIILK